MYRISTFTPAVFEILVLAISVAITATIVPGF